MRPCFTPSCISKVEVFEPAGEREAAVCQEIKDRIHMASITLTLLV